MRQPSTRILATGLFLLAAVTAGQNTNPPCIKSCYNTQPPPQMCENVPDMTLETLSRCTCSSFSVERQHPLLECLRACPESEQATYLAGFSDTTYDCRDLFPGVTVVSTTTKTAGTGTSEPTSSPGGLDDGDGQGATASGGGGGGDSVQPNGAGKSFSRASSITLLAAGGLMVVLVF